MIEKNSIRPLKDNLRANKKFKELKLKKNFQQFLGKINFYYKYIENAAKELKPLYNYHNNSIFIIIKVIDDILCICHLIIKNSFIVKIDYHIIWSRRNRITNIQI